MVVSKGKKVSPKPGSHKRAYMLTGFTLLSCLLMFNYKYFEAITLQNEDLSLLQTSRLFFTRLMFGRTRSRLTGHIMNTPIHPSLRNFVFKSMIKLMNINEEEIKYPLNSYKSISDFFSRYIKEETRPVEDIGEFSVLSPADSKIAEVGELTSDYIKNVKGLTLNVKEFLGAQINKKNPQDTSTKWYYAIFYLSPSQYHHFHAPFNLRFLLRRHISGEVFPVFQGIFRFINNVFDVNERVVLMGEWSGGRIYYTAVSAYNVGNIKIVDDNELATNTLRTQLSYLGGELNTRKYKIPRNIETGEEIGQFKMGSSIVMIFEHKKDFKWFIKHGDQVKVGQKIGGLSKTSIQSNRFIKFRS